MLSASARAHGLSDPRSWASLMEVYGLLDNVL